MKNLKIYFLTILFLTVFIAQSQQTKKDSIAQTTLITDRPDATESPNTVPQGFFQYEGGFLFSKNKAGTGGVDRTALNTGLFRIGVLDNLELRLGYNIMEQTHEMLVCATTAKELSGLDPMLLGFKMAIRQGETGKADLGFMAHVYLPFTASEDFRPQTTAVDFRFSVGHTLNESSSIAYNIGAQWAADEAEMAYVYTVAYGLSLSEKWGVYLELYGDLPENSSPNHSWDTGLTYLINNHIQLDATIGSGITTDQAILLSTGLSVRFPR